MPRVAAIIGENRVKFDFQHPLHVGEFLTETLDGCWESEPLSTRDVHAVLKERRHVNGADLLLTLKQNAQGLDQAVALACKLRLLAFEPFKQRGPVASLLVSG